MKFELNWPKKNVLAILTLAWSKWRKYLCKGHMTRGRLAELLVNIGHGYCTSLTSSLYTWHFRHHHICYLAILGHLGNLQKTTYKHNMYNKHFLEASKIHHVDPNKAIYTPPKLFPSSPMTNPPLLEQGSHEYHPLFPSKDLEQEFNRGT